MAGRPFDGEIDLRRLQVFLVEMRRQVAQAAYFQWGDVLWRMYYGHNRFDPAADIRIWGDAGARIEGFAFYLSVDHNPEFFSPP